MALPGVTTQIKDRFYTLSRTDIPTGPKVLVIAPRSTADGTNSVPDYDPYYAKSESDVITTFGEDSPAHRAYLELVSGGASRIYIVATPADKTQTELLSVADGDPLDLALEAAETELPDIIVLWGRGGHPYDWENPATPANDVIFGWYADNSATGSLSVVKKLADACAEISGRSHPCFGVIGVKPYVGTGSSATENITAANLATHFGFSNLYARETTGFENGMYVSVVATEVKTIGYPTEYGYSNGATVYAGFISQLKAWSAATGKIIFNVSAVRYNPTRPQQEALITKGLVPVALDFNRTPTWVDGLTFSKAASDYTRLTTLRIIFDTINLVRNIAQGFIGEAATLAQRNALETAIGAGLRGMQQLGALITSDFNISYVPAENKAIIDLVLNPAFEMRNIDISISVQL